MPSWKKVLISGSDAALNSLLVSTAFTASGINYPASDGSSGQALITDGAGNLSFTDITAGYGATTKLNVTVPATTWSFSHNMEEKYPVVSVYDDNDDIIIPEKIEAVDDNTLTVYFSTARTGRISAVVGGYAISASSAFTASYGGDFLVDTISIESSKISYVENLDVDATGSEVIASVSTASYDAAFFDYVVKNSTNLRAGTVTAVHNGTNVEYTEASTQDLGNTSPVTLSCDISGGNLRLVATTTSDNWSIKAIVRTL